MKTPTFTIALFPAPIDDWTGSRIVIRSEDCPGGVAAIIGGAEQYANLIAAAPEMFEALQVARIDVMYKRDYSQNAIGRKNAAKTLELIDSVLAKTVQP